MSFCEKIITKCPLTHFPFTVIYPLVIRLANLRFDLVPWYNNIFVLRKPEVSQLYRLSRPLNYPHLLKFFISKRK